MSRHRFIKALDLDDELEVFDGEASYDADGLEGGEDGMSPSSGQDGWLMFAELSAEDKRITAGSARPSKLTVMTSQTNSLREPPKSGLCWEKDSSYPTKRSKTLSGITTTTWRRRSTIYSVSILCKKGFPDRVEGQRSESASKKQAVAKGQGGFMISTSFCPACITWLWDSMAAS